MKMVYCLVHGVGCHSYSPAQWERGRYWARREDWSWRKRGISSQGRSFTCSPLTEAIVHMVFGIHHLAKSEDIARIRTGEREYATRFGEQFPRCILDTDTGLHNGASRPRPAGAFHTRRDLPQDMTLMFRPQFCHILMYLPLASVSSLKSL